MGPASTSRELIAPVGTGRPGISDASPVVVSPASVEARQIIADVQFNDRQHRLHPRVGELRRLAV